jgi:hypothetical protein
MNHSGNVVSFATIFTLTERETGAYALEQIYAMRRRFPAIAAMKIV